jgi:hypothetical protein
VAASETRHLVEAGFAFDLPDWPTATFDLMARWTG